MNVKRKILLQLYAVKVLASLPIFAFIIIMGYVANSLLGTAFFFIAFVFLRYAYNDSLTFHAKSTIRCVCATCVLFGTAGLVMGCINTHTSLLFPLVVGLIATWFLHYIALNKKAYKELEALKATCKTREFSLDTCTEEELTARCRTRFKRDVEYKTERAIKHFVLKLPHEEIDVSIFQSQKERQRMRKILS